MRRRRYEIQDRLRVHSYCLGHYSPSIKSRLAAASLNSPVVAVNSYYYRRLVVDTSFISQEAIEYALVLEKSGPRACIGARLMMKGMGKPYKILIIIIAAGSLLTLAS